MPKTNTQETGLVGDIAALLPQLLQIGSDTLSEEELRQNLLALIFEKLYEVLGPFLQEAGFNIFLSQGSSRLVLSGFGWRSERQGVFGSTKVGISQLESLDTSTAIKLLRDELERIKSGLSERKEKAIGDSEKLLSLIDCLTYLED